MTFIITLIALLIERFFDWSHLRSWNWYANYQAAIAKRFTGKSPYFILALITLPILIVVLVLQLLLQNVLFGFAELLFQLFILLYCLGPQNIWADMFACINALVQGDSEIAAEKLKTSFGISDVHSGISLREQFLNHIFIAANRRIFAVVFWFMILGPVGAVLYRLISLSSTDFSKQEISSEFANDSRSVESVLDWIPVRILTCVFALGGHFVQVFSCWRKKAMRGFDINNQLLVECGAAALGKEDIEMLAEDGSAEKNAMGLLDRSLVILLVFTALFSMF